MAEYRTIFPGRFGLGGTGKIVVDGNELDVTAVGAAAPIAEITTAGGNTVSAGTLQEVLQAIADLADPAA